MKNVFFVRMLGMALVLGLTFTSCGTITKSTEMDITSESGVAAAVTITDSRGMEIYVGHLPAKITVNNSNPSYTVHYTGKDGNPATFEITKSFNY